MKIGKIVQINSEFRPRSFDENDIGGVTIVALCDDGSLWYGRSDNDSKMDWASIEIPNDKNIINIK